MPEWSFQRKLITGVIVICLLAILTSVASLFASRIVVDNMNTMAFGAGREVEDAKALQLMGIQKLADARACLLSGGRDYTVAARKGSAELRALIARMKSQLPDSETRVLLDNVSLAEASHEDMFERALAEFASAPDAPSPSPTLERGEQLKSALSALVTRVESGRVTGLAAARSSLNRAGPLMIAVTIATVFLLVTLCLILVAALNRSYRLQLNARVLAEHGQKEAKVSLFEAEASSRLKDEFLATVSHELRNPLAPILTWTQLLRSGTLDEAKTSRALEVIERNVISQAQLIDDLVDVSRVASGKFRLDVRPIDLVAVIKAAADSQVPASDAKQIRLQLVLDERAGLISGDSERLQQVMWNLISNAIKFTPKGGRVQVLLQRVDSHVEIAVSDSGIGIETEFLPHVFEPFRQGTGGSMRRHGGLGLGLSIVRHIVELHGGEIIAHSEGLERGSKFTVKFPLLATGRMAGDPVRRHPIARDTLTDIRLARLDGTRVLVVDDEPSASEALLELFGSCGAEARVAGSVTEALVIFEAWQPDVLVSDIAMPGEDGYSLIRKIRLRTPKRGGTIPAVALTAYAKIEDRVTILSAGFQMYLSKPADPNELVAVVLSLAKRRGSDEHSVVS